MDELKALRKENAALRDQVTQLIADLARLNERVGELLAVAQRKQRKACAPIAVAPAALPPVVEGEQQRALEERPKAPEKPTADRTGEEEGEAHRAQTASRPSRGRSARAAGRVVLRLRPVGPQCCRPTHRRNFTSSRSTSATESSGATPAAAAPGGERTTLRSLPAPYERSKVTCEWLAWLVYQKFWLLTPLDRIRRDLGERGNPLAMSTLVLHRTRCRLAIGR